jgi:general secretion pathway protein A
MYTAHFGLAELPFSMTPDPRYLYMSERHREALAHLLYGIGEGGGFVQLTGEVGTGKTTLCRCLIEQLPAGVDIALILNPRLTALELLAAVCDELRVPYPPDTASQKLLVDLLYRHLLDAHERGQRTVLIVDEAQDLSPEVLEQIRLLTNLETPTRKLLQIILIGQPELIRLLDREELRQIAQRVTARYHLLPFSEEDTRAYISHRMNLAGQREEVFTDSAARGAHRAARGIPRLINAICDRALLGAYTQDQRRVSAATVRRAADEVLGGAFGRRLARRWRWIGSALGAGVLVAGIAALVAFGSPRLVPWREAAKKASSAAVPELALPTASSADRVDGALRTATTASATPARDGASPRAIATSDRVPASAITATRLGDLLADPTVRADKGSAFSSLYASWHLDFDPSKSSPPCERARRDRLQCLLKAGSWAKIRRYDVPAIIELSSPAGEHRYATVVALDEQTATLDFGGRRHTLPLGEIDLYWDGSFTLLWKAPILTSPTIVPGTRSKDVAWLRQQFAELDGTVPSGKNRDVFDDELRARVIAFQRSRSLVADGIVGEETLTQLSTAMPDPRTPRVWRVRS